MPFFEFWPAFSPPSFDGRFVALAGALAGLLRGPLQGFEQARDLGRTVEDAELFLEDSRHPGTGPHLPAKAPDFRAVAQEVRHQAQVLTGQLGRSASLFAFAITRRPHRQPPADGYLRHSQCLRDLALGPALCPQGKGAFSSLLTPLL